MTLAHKVKHNFNTFSEALIFAWAKYKLQTKLHAGVVSFDFRKKSTGEIRRAKGTLNFDIPNATTKKECPWYIQKFKDHMKKHKETFMFPFSPTALGRFPLHLVK